MADKPIDPLLREFVAAPNGADAQAALDRVVEVHVLPLAQRIARHRLRSWRPENDHLVDRDADDVVSEAMTTLIARLQSLRGDPAAAPVENLLSYSAAVVHSTVAHLGRRRYPERARLKNRLRYVFANASDVRLWTAADGELVCGLVAWQPRGEDQAAAAALMPAVSRHDAAWSQLTPKHLISAVRSVVQTLSGPVSFDSLVTAVATSAQLIEPRVVSDAADLQSTAEPQDVALDRTRHLVRVWQEVCELPVAQRTALLLNLRHTTGAGLLWLLPMLGVASIRQIAAALEMPFKELAQLWQELPMDDLSIAARLGCTRQRVINLRMAARKRLTNRLGGPPSPRRDFRAGRDNLAPVSTSMEST